MDKLLVAVVTLLMSLLLAGLLAAPLAFLVMISLGNVGVNVSFWGCVPIALLLGVLKTSVTTKAEK